MQYNNLHSFLDLTHFKEIQKYFCSIFGSNENFKICFRDSKPAFSTLRKFISLFTIAMGARIVIMIIFKIKDKDIFYHPVNIIPGLNKVKLHSDQLETA